MELIGTARDWSLTVALVWPRDGADPEPATLPPAGFDGRRQRRRRHPPSVTTGNDEQHGSAMAIQKTTCPITRAQFREHAQPVEVVIKGIPMTADVKEFSTGSLGWYLTGKTSLKVGEKSVSVQIGMNLTIVGSKDLPPDAGAAGDDAPPSGET